MKQKDYELIAESLKDYRESGFTSGVNIRKSVEKLNEILIPKFKKDNKNFKMQKYLKHCGL
jgi:hypothetical protein